MTRRRERRRASDWTRLDDAIDRMVLARALERGMMARATGTSEADDVFGPARAVRELGDAARVGAMRAMAATTEVVMRAGASDVVRVRGRARRGASRCI